MEPIFRAKPLEASGAEVNKTLLGDAVLLAIDDPHGIRTAWRLTPGLAEGLGNDLVKYAKSLKPKATKH